MQICRTELSHKLVQKSDPKSNAGLKINIEGIEYVKETDLLSKIKVNFLYTNYSIVCYNIEHCLNKNKDNFIAKVVNK